MMYLAVGIRSHARLSVGDRYDFAVERFGGGRKAEHGRTLQILSFGLYKNAHHGNAFTYTWFKLYNTVSDQFYIGRIFSNLPTHTHRMGIDLCHRKRVHQQVYISQFRLFISFQIHTKQQKKYNEFYYSL